MEKDQIEILTHSRDVRHVLKNLPLTRDPSAQKVEDTITEESDDLQVPGEGPYIQVLLKGLNWATYAVAIMATVFLTWATVSFYTR